MRSTPVKTRFPDVSRDARLIFAAKIVRTFCYGGLGVFFPVYLSDLGLDATQVGLAVSLTLLASAAMTYLVRRPAERYGPRAVLAVQAALIAVAAMIFLLTRQPWLAVAAAMIGNL